MRERTPSADDTPKRAPPAPSREAASADAAGSVAPNDTIGDYRTKLTGISSASDTTSSSDRMVASTQSLEDLGVNHPANAAGSNSDRQQQQQLQERYGHPYRSSAQTAQDKRSRLSNVINNLRKKVPDGAARGNADSPRKEEDDRNSVERNLETLEKYVMTVLNGVIKDDEEEGNSEGAEKTKEPERRRKGTDDEEDPTDVVKSEPSGDSDIEAAVVPRLEDSSMTENIEETESSETDCSNKMKGMTEESIEDSEVEISQNLKESSSRNSSMEEECMDVEKEFPEDNRDVPREKKENRTLGTIIMNRLSEHQVEERANVDDGRGGDQLSEHEVKENAESRTVCEEFLEDLLNDVHRTIDDRENQQKTEECEKSMEIEGIDESRMEETKDSNANGQELSKTSLHCSLPLDKVASVLQNCQTSESIVSRLSSGSLSSPPSTQNVAKTKTSPGTAPPVRHLCLYCDRKFMSISLRQRHTERVHQVGGGRRSERNPRKPSQNCQYCLEKYDTLEALFQHTIGNHGDKYHACIQCSTRYPTREALVGHLSETHGGNAERTVQVQPEKIKDGSPCKEFCSQNLRCEKTNVSSVRERRSEEKELECQGDSRQSDSSSRTKLIAIRDSIDNNPASPDFDSSFYSNVSCNIRENLLHHLDGKLQTMSSTSSSSTCAPTIAASSATMTTTETKSQQQQPQQSYYDHSVNQIQFPIDISLTAATPVYSKDYSTGEEYENSSEYAHKAGKTSSGSRPRRVSFEKYNFPRKYDGKEQWTCSIKDLSKFDISTQLSLRKKQQLIKERLTISRLRQISLMPCEITEVSLRDQEQDEPVVKTAASNQDDADGNCEVDAISTTLDIVRCDLGEPPPNETKKETTTELSATAPSKNPEELIITEFNAEFGDFMRLRRLEQGSNKTANIEKIIFAELSGEWSRTRIYICGACGSKHVTLKEMEDHKASMHPRVLCSHFELTDDQREHYKHLYLPGQSAATDEARDAELKETVCTKCTKSCISVAELHRHMLECGGDHAWLLGLTGSGKKKCKWRPFGSRSRRRRQRGMKRNIQNSQTQPRVVNADRPKEKHTPAGPRVRPSDRESIQKMLANLPAKRATRKVLQDSAIRSQNKLRNRHLWTLLKQVQNRTRPGIGENSSVSRISRNKAALRNKLLKNAKSIQRKRCRSDNISAVIESVVKKCHENEKRSDIDGDKNAEAENEGKKDAKEINEGLSKAGKSSDQDEKIVRPKVGRPRILGKKGNMKTKIGTIGNPQFQGKGNDKLTNLKAKGRFVKFKSGAMSETKGEEAFSPKSTPKNAKTPKATDKDDTIFDIRKPSTSGIKNKNKFAQGMLKKKRLVDPVASLNASIKAKSQLRTQDGKFARNPNKDSLMKSSEMKTDDWKPKISDSIEIKTKSKASQKLKRIDVQPPRRVTRLSSDSDKMPTLEPVVQISSSEEYAEKSANDLPILSPATSSMSLQEQKALRTSSRYISKDKEGNNETDAELEAVLEKSIKEQKSTRGRKPKEETIAKRKEAERNMIEENEASKNNSKALKEGRTKSRKSLPVKNANGNENKEEISKGEMIKKDSRTKKEETMKETRSNSKTRIEKDLVKLPFHGIDVPLEVKKLLGRLVSKEDLLNTLELASNDVGLKRSLRQSTPRSEVFQMSDKNLREFEDELDGSKGTKKIETIRKSFKKNAEKKSDDKVTKTNLEKDLANNVIQNERSQQGKRDSRAGTKAKETAIESSDVENKIDGKQTRGLLNDAKSESSSETASDSLRKNNSLLDKRRSRNKSIDEAEESNICAAEKQSCIENDITPNEKEDEKELEETIEKVDKTETEADGDSNSDDRSDSTVVNLNLSHLQSETSNLSIDSGKENSLETSVNIHSKLKVTRPKKTWGARRERSSRKRSLNNVIGILTEGMNIPVEAQQSVQVLTVQTSLDNPDRVARNGNTQQPSGGEGTMIAVDSAFSELSVLVRSEQESAENEVVMATNATDDHHADNEKDVRLCPDKAQDENVFVNQKIDVSSKVAIAKPRSPANDIILDLSRRKPKGKGSFLEKIVSKIAKQKDALLEGEVGSLLDNATDELTSILDEIGPALIDNAENANSCEASHALKNGNKNVMNISTDKEASMIVDSEVQSKDDKINIEDVVSECSTDLLQIQDSLEENLAAKIEIQVQSENQIKIKDVSDIEMKNDNVINRQVSNAMRSVEESQVESCEDKSATNEGAIVPIEIPNETPSSVTDTSTEVHNSPIITQKTNLKKLEGKESVMKSRRKSSKRSLEDTNWPRKSKRRSIEIVEEHIEENTQKELRVDDIVAFIAKPEEASSAENKLNNKDNESMQDFITDIEVEELQYSERKIIKNNLESSNLEKNRILAEGGDESNLEKSADLPEAACEDTKKLTTNLEEPTAKIIPEEENIIHSVIIADVLSRDSIDENADSSALSSEKSMKRRKSSDRIQKKDQTTSEPQCRRTSKRKSQFSANPPVDTAVDVLQTSVKVDESENILSASLIEIEDSNVSSEKSLSSMQTISKEHEEAQSTDDSSNFVNSAPLKITKKRGAKKKSLADEHLELSEDELAEVALKLNEGSSIADSNERLSVNLEHFKVPEVKDLLQGAKKRGPRKKSLPEDGRWNGESVPEESQANEESAEVSEMSSLSEKTEEQAEETEKCVIGKQSSTKRLERSSSSGSIGLNSYLAKTRSALKKKTQSSNEDLANSSMRNQGAESTDDLSESSCASESSYFRQKRFAKKKKKEKEITIDNAQIDSSTDLESSKSDKQNLKEMSKSKSLLDEHLDLSGVDDIDVPVDIQASLENAKALENIEQKFELAEKSSSSQNEDTNELTADDSTNKDSCAALENISTSNIYDSPDDPVTPKKRAAGNFVVVHTKTGEILIVEKKKKLTKEAARFFCNVCTTSFTRKSSLKKHTQSQSHLIQMTKSSKEKLEPGNNDASKSEAEDINNDWKNNETSDEQTSSVPIGDRSHEIRTSIESNDSYASSYATSAELTDSLTDFRTTRQQTLEDKLLDEEICKITENMSYDDYVLTDHMTPEQPVLSSTPIKSSQKKQEDLGKSKNGERKRSKSKKKNLAEEHLILDSPINDSQSGEHNSTKEMKETIEKIKDVLEEAEDLVEMKSQAESIVKSLNNEVDCSKSSESRRTTRSALKKLSKLDNEEKEENQVSTETNRFSLRPRRSRNVIQHYEESDVEADMYFIDTSMEINSDEMENNRDLQKTQKAIEETQKDALLEKTRTDAEDKSCQDVEAAKLKTTDSVNDTKKRKRGRPRLKDRIVLNSSVSSGHIEPEVNENDIIAAGNLEESKLKDQKLSSHTKERLDETGKPPNIDVNIQPSKRRGRPRKNPIQITINSSVQEHNSSVVESMRTNHDEVKKITEQTESHSETVIEKDVSINISSSTPNVESLPAIQDETVESNLSETKTDLLNVEEIPRIELHAFKDQPTQEVELVNIKLAKTAVAKDCDVLAFNASPEKDDIINMWMLSEGNARDDDAECALEKESNHDDGSVDVLINSTAEPSAELSSQITEQISIETDDLRSVEPKTIRLDGDESSGIPKLPDVLEISEEKQTKSIEEKVLEESQEETKISSESEKSEDETLITDDKLLPVTNFHELLPEKTINDLENIDVLDERTTRPGSSSKKLSRSFQSASKERGGDRKKSKTSRGRRKRIVTSKIAELSSDSDNEDDRIESASSNKNKIVKSVFGRVFGGEKTDKVKEVLNDWVSRSEEDSDISKSASEAKSCPRGATRIPANGHKKNKKRHSGFDTKKDAERSPRKKKNDKNSNAEVHGKSKNRKKREKGPDVMLENDIESPINPIKRRYRESKIRADKMILRFFDDSPIVSDEDVGEIKEIRHQFGDAISSGKDEESRKYEEEWNEEQTKDKNSTSEDWQNHQGDHNDHGKSRNNSSYRKKRDSDARNERSSSLSQFNVFKYRRRESKTKAGEKIWRAFDNETSSCLSDDQDLNETREVVSKERENEFYEYRDINHSNNSMSMEQKDDNTWTESPSLKDQDQVRASSKRGRPRKDTNGRKRQDFNASRIDKMETNEKISKDSDNESPIRSRDQKTKNGMQNDQTENLITNQQTQRIKDNTYESFAYDNSVVSKHMDEDQNNSLVGLDHQTTSFRKSKKGIGSEDWKHSGRNLKSEDLVKDDQRIEKDAERKNEESTMSSRSCSSLAEPIMKDLPDLDRNSQMIRESDDDDNEEEEEEEVDNDLGRRRMSPFYARETPDSSIESSSNNEEEEDGEEEEERATNEDNSRKTNHSEFSGEKIVIRSPSLGHRSDVVTIAPTDAIEDNALDVPREIESTEPRQGKILNFDEELFVECCSRLKATSENELRGAKKIKLDHTESYHRYDDQPQGFRVNRDRWRDVESQNSLGSLLESVNQLLGEEMYNSHDRSYRTRGSERSSRSASPDASRVDNLGYEDSLDVAFEHNNKLRDKIQQRMRESENLIASTFGQKTNDGDRDHLNNDKRDSVGNLYSSSMHEHEQLSASIASNREQVSSPGHKNKMNSTLGGLLDKALSNLLHSNGKHDHNGSAPMKLLAELACARAPTTTSPEDIASSGKNHQSVKMVAAAVAVAAAAAVAAAKDTPDSPKRPTKDTVVTPKNSPVKKIRNPIKELFERKKEINDRKEQERSKAMLVELNTQKQRKPKRNKKQQQQQQKFPLIRRNEHYGLMEKKKHCSSFDRKVESERIKDVYEFDEEESQTAPTLGSVMSYRCQIEKSYEANWSRTKNIDGDLSTALENGKTSYVADIKSDAVIDRNFQELEKFAPKTKGALKSFQSEEQQQRVIGSIIGPMDEFVERKQQRLKRPTEQSVKQPGKLKKRGRSSKKRARNAWYENDSSDEFRTAAKTEDIGVGISKSQRACSKGKQNLFAELSTSSESEYERDDVDYEITNDHRSSKSRKSPKKPLDVDVDVDIDAANHNQHIINESRFDNEDQIANDWRNQTVQEDIMKKDHDAAKSESEMSDHSLIIDERKTTDEARNSDDDVDNQYERTFELDDLYREDSSDAETEIEENEDPIPTIEEAKNEIGAQALDENTTLQTETASMNDKDNYAPENELIPLEEALDFLDRHEDLDQKSENIRAEVHAENNIVNGTVETMDEVSNDGIINEEIENGHLSSMEIRDEKEEPDDDIPVLPEKLSSNEKPQKESDNNLPLHVFLSRKVQESKKRKQQQLDKLREEQERILMDFQPTRRQRKCAIGKQGLLAEISSSDEELYVRDNIKKGTDHDKLRKKRESKEKRKERYLEKKHEQMIAKEQKAIEEEILREVGKRKEILAHSADDIELNNDPEETKVISGQSQKKKYQTKEKQKKSSDENIEENTEHTDQSPLGSSEDDYNKLERSFTTTESTVEDNNYQPNPTKRKKISKSPARSRKFSKSENGKISTKRSKESTGERSKKTSTGNKDSKERRSSSGKRDSDDEELKTTKSWNKVEEGVGVAIGRRKRTAALQLYYWSSSSDEEEAPEPAPAPEEEEDDRQEQHGWIVGDSHKRMITMLAMEKQLKEKRRRSEDEFEPGKAKSKKHRNSTS